VKINKVLIFGAGTMGRQIGFQCAMHGFETVTYDINESSLKACRARHARFAELFVEGRGADQQQVEAALARISYSSDLAAAAHHVDLVSESVPEIPRIKAEVYGRLNALCPERTIFTTNTSTLLPSDIAGATGRPARFVALHFANPVWDSNIGEVMGHGGTDPEVFERVLEFASEIGMVPIRLETEASGFISNSLLVPFLMAAQGLVANGVASHRDVDRTWMVMTKMPMGPFGIMDLVGLETAHNIALHGAETRNDENMRRNAAFLKQHFVDRGKLGLKSGEGYYTYPDPAYKDDDFLG
jgi:3-hydroxybutyryl-CoA dehydrogenase